MKRKNKLSKYGLNIIMLLIGGAIGLFIAYLAITITSSNSSFLSYISVFAILFLAFIISFLIHIIIHELGHLIFGLATKYSFVSFRIGSLILIRENGKLKIKKYSIPGTAGQCLMMPPDLKDGKYPFVLYNLGGVILNIIVSLISILAAIYIRDTNLLLYGILMLFGIVGIFLAMTNGIPLKISGIVNDAHNVRSMIKDDEASRSFYLQLRVNGLSSQGMRYKDMDLNSFKVKEGSDISSPLNTGLKLIEYSWYLDNMDFDNARICIDSFVPYFDKLLDLYVNEINCERMFLELIGPCNKDFIDSLYDKDLKKYIKTSKYMISKKRVLMSYEAFYNEDKANALEYYKEINELYDNYPAKGEADMELMLADWMKEKIAI